MNSPPIIDMHLHFGAPKDEESGCYWSEKFKTTAAYYAMLLVTRSLFTTVNILRVKSHILNVINGSRFVDRSVLLAMDQVYDKDGQVQAGKTHLYVPNKYIAGLSRENERVLFGASVHPYRQDWEQELDFCLENGAVLCKWIPSSQLINPADDKCKPFYQKLARHNLPLLCHAGPEYAIPTSDKSYEEFNNPKYLRQALDLGVTVILAHCALPYFAELDIPYQDDYQAFLRLFNAAAQYNWRLYADLSAVTGPLRKKYIPEIKAKIPAQRLLFGSDYPVPISEFSYHGRMHPITWLRLLLQLLSIRNPLDKNYKIIKAMQFDPCIFTNIAGLFEQIRRR